MKNVSMLSKSMIVALSIAGVGAAAIAAPAATNTKAAASSSEAVSAMQSKISLTQAINIAKQNAKGDLVSAEFDYDDDDGTSKYEVEFVAKGTAYEVKIDANTGKVLKTKQEKLDKKDMAEYSAMKQAKVTLTSAMQKAAQSVNGKVISAEFELKKGQSLYDIEVVKGNQIYDVSIDANTGKVLSSQVDVEDDD
ncbi:PepSY domain-containing protein [Psychrobacter sp. ANT_WB68]|uniref:PepSY domain-containing protein n=1 Tax=Psychrobacter sp. ANT_WB68 TaxID=2597355 RepID=UPI00165DEBD6|nr:PepSY domain-containing protein [Psychrobacter sp. ANT_WB68]